MPFPRYTSRVANRISVRLLWALADFWYCSSGFTVRVSFLPHSDPCSSSEMTSLPHGCIFHSIILLCVRLSPSWLWFGGVMFVVGMCIGAVRAVCNPYGMELVSRRYRYIVPFLPGTQSPSLYSQSIKSLIPVYNIPDSSLLYP